MLVKSPEVEEMTAIEKLNEIADTVCIEYLDDIPKAVETLKLKARKSKLESEGMDELLHRAYQELIWDARVRNNRNLKSMASDTSDTKEIAAWKGPAKVLPGASVATAVQKSYFSYCINKMHLGAVQGDEIPYLIDVEKGKADGHQKNIAILTALKSKVKGTKTVAQCVTEKQLEKIFQKVWS